MMHQVPNSRRLTPSLLALAAGLAGAPAPAAGAEADAAGDGLEEIVVTAQKRSENLQKTPISITVLSADTLDNRRVISLSDLGDGAVPSLKVAPFFSRTSALIVNIRGVGVLSDSNQPARDQGVGVYIDGVYLGRAQGLGTALYDVTSIEVLKGPQGTLFGRNTMGGAVSIVTAKPTGELGGRIIGGIGNYDSWRAEGHVNLPSFANIALKFDGVLVRRGGLVDNPLAGAEDFGAYDKRGFAVSALWTPSPDFSANYAYDNSYDASSSLYQQISVAGTVPRAPILPLEPRRVRTASIGVPQLESVGRIDGHRLTLEWRAADAITLRSITALRNLSQSQFDNGSASAAVFQPNASFSRISTALFDQDQQSQEIQIVGDLPRIKFVAGGLWYREHAEDNAQAFNTMRFNATGTAATVLQLDYAAQRIDRASRITTRSYGLFGQATWTPPILDDRVHLTGGLRWTRDQKRGELFIVNGAPPNVDGAIGPRRLDASWSRVDPLVTLAVDLATDVQVYGRWSTGYRSGGANTRSLRLAPFNPESLSMFEIGAKSEFWDNRARFNLAAYTGSYRDIQLDFFANYIQRDAQGNIVQTNRTTSETANAPGDGRVSGVEADLTVAPVEWLTLGASYAYNYVRIPPTVNPFPQGAQGIIVPTPIRIYPVYTPDHTATGFADVSVPLGGAILFGHVDVNWDNGFFANYTDPAPTLAQPKGDEMLTVNARLGLTDIALPGSSSRLAITAWARNLLDNQYFFYRSTLSPLIGTGGFLNEPRTFGIEATLRF